MKKIVNGHVCAKEGFGARVIVEENEVSSDGTCILNSSGHVSYCALTKEIIFLKGLLSKGEKKFTLSPPYQNKAKLSAQRIIVGYPALLH